MTDIEIRDVLGRATDDLQPPPDLLERVRTGGRRRVARRRTVLAAAVATAAAGTGAAVSARSGHDALPYARLHRPTRGDMAGDTAFLDQVAGIWRARLGADTILGRPHVAWAMSTPAGPVAVVSSRAMPGHGRPYGWTGFVSGEHVVSVEALRPGVVNSEALLAGPDRSTLVVVDGGRPLSFSSDLRYDAGGRVGRVFRPVTLDADGVMVVPVVPQPDRIRTALRTGTTAVRPAGVEPPSPPALLSRLLPGRERAWGDDAAVSPELLAAWELRQRDVYGDPYGVHGGPPGTYWCIRGSTADARRVLVQTLVLDQDVRVFRTVSATTTGTPVYLGLLNSPETIAVLRVRLPDSLGVVVAASGATLRYRTASADWLTVTGDAALLPAAARFLEVTPPGGRMFRVPLS